MDCGTRMDAGFEPLDWSGLDQLEAATPVIPGLLNEGESGALIGQAECGKSLLMLDVAVSLALGKPVLGQPAMKPMPVMYVDMENPVVEVRERVRRMGYSLSDIGSSLLHYFTFPDLPPLDTNAGGQTLALACQRFEPKLIVLDTISRMVEGKEDSADTWQNMYVHTMVPLRRQNRAVLRLDHQGHDSSRGARGSSAKRDDVDVAWIMKREGSKVTLSRHKGRSLAHPDEVVLVRHSAPTCHLPMVAGRGGRVDECVDALNHLHVPIDWTRDEAGVELRANNYKFGNDIVGAALRMRRDANSATVATPPKGT